VVAALVLVAAVAASCGTGAPAAPAGIVRNPPPEVGSVVLPDASNGGAAFATRADAGHVLLVYFGFTSCPDVCPTTLADVRRAIGDLETERAERVDLAVITVDPERDGPEELTTYAQAFVPGARALRTDDPAALAEAADAYGASFQVTKNEQGEIEVGHTAFLYAVDADGAIRLTWPFGTPAEDLTSDIDYLFDQGV
jgi:protein SCO1/2